MDRMLIVIFPNESKAYEGKRALQQLDSEGSISVYAYAVLTKNADGTTSVKQGDDVGPIGTLVGTSLGSLIGVLGGPVGVAAGAAAGMAAGSALDVNNVRVGTDFIDDVQKILVPPNVAVSCGSRRGVDHPGGYAYGGDRRERFSTRSFRGKGQS